MPKTTKKQTTKTVSKRSAAKTTRKPLVAEKRSKPRKTQTPVLTNEPVAIYGVFAGTEEIKTGMEALAKAGVREENISTACLEPVAPEAVNATVAEVKEEVGDVFAAAARVAGSVLAFGSLPLLAPMLIAGPVMSAIGMGASRLWDRPAAAAESECPADATTAPVLVSVTCDNPKQAQRAAKALEKTGAADLAMSAEEIRRGEDLEQRPYRDEEGKLHHHTRTYLRDHVNA